MRFVDRISGTGRSLCSRLAALGTFCCVLALPLLAPVAHGSGGQVPDAGSWLVLDFSGFNAGVQFVRDGEPLAAQALDKKSWRDCSLVTDGSLLGFSGSSTPGILPLLELIGLKNRCGQVGDGEFLRIQLGSDERLSDQKVVEAELGLAIHQSVRILIEARNDGELVQEFEVVAGSYVGEPTTSDHVLSCPISLFHACRVPLSAAGLRFNELVFRSDAKDRWGFGAWSLGRTASKFRLLDFDPDGDLDCGDTVADTGVVGQRTDDVGQAGGECTKIPYALSFDGQTVAFLADYGALEQGTEPAFAFAVDWRTEVLQVPQTAAVPYSGENPPSTPATVVQQVPFSVQWFGLETDPEAAELAGITYLADSCPGQPVYEEGNPLPIDLTFPPEFDRSENGPNDMSLDLPGFQFGCVVSRVLERVANESCDEMPAADQICVSAQEILRVQGDWTATRTLR